MVTSDGLTTGIMRRLSYMDAVIEAIAQEMRRDDRVIILGQDIGRFEGPMQSTKSLFGEFGKRRVIETPISESAMVGAAIGAALQGLRPIVEVSFGEFLPCAMNQLVLQAPNIHYMTGASATVPLVIRTRVGDGPYGGHPQDYSAWFAHLPGLKVLMPATPADAKGLMTAALRDDDPVLFIEPMSLVHGSKDSVPEGDYVVPIGRANIIRAGRDVTIVAIGSMLPPSIRAADQLSREGIEAEVVDMRSLSPLDCDTVLESLKRTSKLVIAHEAWTTAGIGAEIAAVAADRGISHLDGPVRRIGARAVPIPSGPLRRYVLPSTGDVVDAVRSLVAM